MSKNGASVANADAVHFSYFDSGDTLNPGWQPSFLGIGGTYAHGVHFDITLPEWTDIAVTDGIFQIDARPGTKGIVVGEWTESPTSVPEPSTMLLLSMGLVGLVGAGAKKLKKQS
ncbi:MAG: PEP-CTERM sorting domain-containing protein [Desulfosarcina sp.]|nr:PEP-CTERM sorting domain-containing protein [Desulfobacterales bacterium]